jgi:hypothetical protein
MSELKNSRVQTIQSNGVPKAFTQTTASGGDFLISKGQLNKLRLRPCIRNEHCESSRTIQGVVSSGNIVGQIFKASKNNINCLGLTLESSEGTIIDNFETYANSAALQVEWEETDATDKAELETVIVKTGTKSMRLPMGATVLDKWINTVVSVDYTDYTFSLDFYQSASFAAAGMEFFIGDGTETKSIDLTIQDENVWQHFDININAMSEDSGTPVTVTAITKIGFRLSNRAQNALGYVDNLIATPPPGFVDIELWDMGASIPVSGVESIDSGTQYEQLGDLGINGGTVAAEVRLDLQGGKRLYNATRFIAGVAFEIPTNQALTVDNYYIVTLNYVDTEVNVYGPDPTFLTDYYENGYAFTAPDKSTAITAIGPYSDLMFIISSTQDVYIAGYFQFLDDTPGNNSKTNIFIENIDMGIEGIIVGNATAQQNIIVDLSLRPYYLPVGGKFEQYYNDDFTDSVTSLNMQISYLFEPPDING